MYKAQVLSILIGLAMASGSQPSSAQESDSLGSQTEDTSLIKGPFLPTLSYIDVIEEQAMFLFADGLCREGAINALLLVDARTWEMAEYVITGRSDDDSGAWKSVTQSLLDGLLKRSVGARLMAAECLVVSGDTAAAVEFYEQILEATMADGGYPDLWERARNGFYALLGLAPFPDRDRVIYAGDGPTGIFIVAFLAVGDPLAEAKRCVRGRLGQRKIRCYAFTTRDLFFRSGSAPRRQIFPRGQCYVAWWGRQDNGVERGRLNRSLVMTDGTNC